MNDLWCMSSGIRHHSVSARSKHLSLCKLFFSKHRHKEIMHILSQLRLGTMTCWLFCRMRRTWGWFLWEDAPEMWTQGVAAIAGADHEVQIGKRQHTVQANNWACGWEWKKYIHPWVGQSNKKFSWMTLLLKTVNWSSGIGQALELTGLGFESWCYHSWAMWHRTCVSTSLSHSFLIVRDNSTYLGE